MPAALSEALPLRRAGSRIALRTDHDCGRFVDLALLRCWTESPLLSLQGSMRPQARRRRSPGRLGAATAEFFSTEDGSMIKHAFFPRLRPSKSHRTSRQAEIARFRRMTFEERVKAALGLAAHFAEMLPAPRKD